MYGKVIWYNRGIMLVEGGLSAWTSSLRNPYTVILKTLEHAFAVPAKKFKPCKIQYEGILYRYE